LLNVIISYGIFFSGMYMTFDTYYKMRKQVKQARGFFEVGQRKKGEK